MIQNEIRNWMPNEGNRLEKIQKLLANCKNNSNLSKGKFIWRCIKVANESFANLAKCILMKLELSDTGQKPERYMKCKPQWI